MVNANDIERIVTNGLGYKASDFSRTEISELDLQTYLERRFYEQLYRRIKDTDLIPYLDSIKSFLLNKNLTKSNLYINPINREKLKILKRDLGVHSETFDDII